MTIPSPSADRAIHNIELRLASIERTLARLADCIECPCVDFQTYAVSQHNSPYTVQGFTLTNRDNTGTIISVSIEQRGNFVALHCSYSIEVKMPHGCQSVEITYLEGGGEITLIGQNSKDAQKVPNTPAGQPQSEILSLKGDNIVALEIHSANEMYLLKVCCT